LENKPALEDFEVLPVTIITKNLLFKPIIILEVRIFLFSYKEKKSPQTIYPYQHMMGRKSRLAKDKNILIIKHNYVGSGGSPSQERQLTSVLASSQLE
jgi:hypothetical protein